MSIRQNGGVFGRHPTFETMETSGAAIIGAGLTVGTGIGGGGAAAPSAGFDMRANSGADFVSILKNEGAGRTRLRLDPGGTSTCGIQFYQNGASSAFIENNDATGNMQIGVKTSASFGSGSASVGIAVPRVLADGGSGTGLAARNNVANGGFPLLVINQASTGQRLVGFYTGSGTPTSTGSITSDGTTTSYNNSSDYRLKENISPLSDAVDRLKELKPSRFAFKVNPGKIVDGFIAHEVQGVVPEAVTGEKDGVDADGNPEYQGIDQSKLVPLLVAALQDALARIEALEAK